MSEHSYSMRLKKLVDEIYGAELAYYWYLKVPFGKYKGADLKDVPITYLLETTSAMPSTSVFVCVVKTAFKDVMLLEIILEAGLCEGGNLARKLTLKELFVNLFGEERNWPEIKKR